MKIGFTHTVMIQKQSNSLCSGRAHNHQKQKRYNRFGVQQGACSLFFFYVKGIIHCEFVPPNTSVNSDFYCNIPRCLRENVPCERPELWCNHNWLLHHKNHKSLKTTEFATNNNMVIIPHPPYSPDLAPCVFALFPELKMKLKG
jgi:hypothetical protein